MTFLFPALLVSGYLKDIQQSRRAFLDDSPVAENLARARLQLELREGPVGLVADYDHELITGSFLRSLDRKIFGVAYPPAWLDLDWTIRDGTDAVWRHRFYRLYAESSGGDWLARAGRQTVAWGSGKIWNPTDVLNPYPPLTLERDERQGFDGVYVRRELGSLSRVEAAWAPMSNWGASALLARARTNVASTDVSLMGGKPAYGPDAWMVGGDAARDVSGSGVHAEGSYTGGLQDGWRYSAGVERTLSSPSWLKDAWLLAEYYHNGLGAASSARYDYAALFSGRQISLARDYLGFAFREDLHPLLRAEAYVVWNLDDGSAFAGPALEWSALSSLTLRAGWQHFLGGGVDEFGRLSDVVYLQGQFYF